MSRNAILISIAVVTIVAGAAHGQFLGDAVAAAGLSISEYQAGEIIAASGGLNDPALTPTNSTQPATLSSQSPESLGTDVGGRPKTTGTTGTAGTSTPGSTPTASGGASPTTSSRPSGSATGFAGAPAHAAAIDPKAAAAWRDAFRPAGTKVAKAPADAVNVESFGKPYSYSKGMFFKENAGSWEVVAGPLGAVITEKPVGAATVFGNGKPYTYYAGTFYVYDATKKGYEVVQPPLGATVEYIPEAAKKADWNGSTHYEYGGTHYKPFYRGSSVVYTVAGS